MDATFRYPPLTYLLFLDDQPSHARATLQRAVDAWNAAHRSRFVTRDVALSLTLPDGVLDEDRDEVRRLLTTLADEHGFRWHEGAERGYDRAEAYLTAEYIRFVGAGITPGSITNSFDAFGPEETCPECGREGRHEDRPLREPLRIDARILRLRVDAGSRTHEAPDFIHLSNGGRLVSQRFVAALAAYGAKGFELVDVIDIETGDTSKSYFLLAATHAITRPCPTHTPTQHAGCWRCGKGLGNVLGNLHFEPGLLEGLDVVSRHRDGFADLYFSNGLAHHLLASGLTGLHPSAAFDSCPHASAPAHPRTRTLTATARADRALRAPRSKCSIDAFLRFVRAPNASALCERRGETSTIERTFELAHLVEPGASARELDALEARFPDVAHLRPLAAHADGILLFHQADQTPERFPSREAIRETQGAVCVSAALCFEKSCDWSTLHDELVDDSASHSAPFVAAHGVPFATLVNSSDRLVCADGKIFYFSPLESEPHNEQIAANVEELLGIVTEDLAHFLRRTASVTTYDSAEHEQYVPTAFSMGTP